MLGQTNNSSRPEDQYYRIRGYAWGKPLDLTADCWDFCCELTRNSGWYPTSEAPDDYALGLMEKGLLDIDHDWVALPIMERAYQESLSNGTLSPDKKWLSILYQGLRICDIVGAYRYVWSELIKSRSQDDLDKLNFFRTLANDALLFKPTPKDAPLQGGRG